jgi:hypothetical protein
VPVQEAAEREQITEVDGRVELNAGECRLGLAVEQRVDPGLRRARRIAHRRRIGARELAAAQHAARAMGAAGRIGQRAAAVAGPAVSQGGLGTRVAALAAADQQHAVSNARCGSTGTRSDGSSSASADDELAPDRLENLFDIGIERKRRDT